MNDTIISSSSASTVRGGVTARLQWKWTLLASVGILVAAFGWMIYGLPYAAGYADHRLSIVGWLLRSWQDPTWQHGALAAPIAAFLVWRRRKVLAALPLQTSYVGLAIALFSLVLFWIGYRGNFYYIGYASVQLLVAGAVLWLAGWRWFWTVSFAWMILSFAWPYLFVEDTVAFKLRFLMVSATGKILNTIGVATLQDGTRLLSAAVGDQAEGARFSMNVDGPCSGLRSLFALMMVSALFGYFRQRTWWRRGLLFALSVPLAVFANMVRILILTFATMAFGERFALGNGGEYSSNFHLLTGVFVFIVSLSGLSFVEFVLNKCFRREKPIPLIEG